MFDVMADWLTVPLLNHEGGKTPKRIGLAHPSISPYGVFTCADGTQILISIQSDREWVKLCEVFLGQPELGSDPRFATNVARVNNRPETDALVAAGFARRTAADAIAALLKADVALATVNDMEGLANHPHLRRISVETPNGPVAYPAPAPVFSDHEREYGPVPGLPSNSGTRA
jgi:formyl-CoA transferase